MQQAKTPRRMSLEDWVERLSERDIPVFASTVTTVRNIVDDDSASANSLSRAILHDAALTTKVLRFAHSIYFNPGRQPINTISRAIIVLGFEMVGNIVLSVTLIDALQAGKVRDRAVMEMSSCFQAAVQARALAIAMRDVDPEEVFIAALLARVGEIAFWCFGENDAVRLDRALRATPEARVEDLQMQQLGFRLRNLSAALARRWHLGPLVTEVTEPTNRHAPREKLILLTHKLALSTRKNGWDHVDTRTIIAQLVEVTGMNLNELRPKLQESALEAAQVANQFGLLPERNLPSAQTASDENPSENLSLTSAAKSAPPPVLVLQPDPILQLKILRDLSTLMNGAPAPNEIMQLLLEGMFRGLGMGRALFALLTPDRRRLVAKLALGYDAPALMAHFSFEITYNHPDVVSQLIKDMRPLRLKANEETPGSAMLVAITGSDEGLLAPIIAKGKAVGLFYADRLHCNLPLDEDSWQGFLHFAQQGSLCFEHLSAIKPPV